MRSILVLLVLATTADAAEPATGWFLRNQVAARINPFGLFDEVRLGHRWKLTDGISASVFGNASISPAFARAGAGFDLQLLSVLNLSAIYEGGGYFGTFNLTQSFPTVAAAEWSEAEIANTPGYAAPMHQLIVGAFINVPLGRFIFRSNNRLVFQQLKTREGDTVFYDQNWETLFPNAGLLYVNDVDALVQVIPGLRIGARYNVTHPFFTAAQLSGASASVTTQRLGPLVSYLFFEKPRAAFNAPTLSLLVNWWVQHPHRVSPVPYVGLAFTFRSELF